MFSRSFGFVLILTGLTFSTTILADLRSDVLACLEKTNSDERLDCYDTVVKYYKSRPIQSKQAQVTTPNNAPATTVEQPVMTSKPQANATPPQKVPPQQKSAEDTFGKSTAEDIESIQSKMLGEFSGWKKGMKLKLENGQTWKVTSNKSGYRKMTNPMVTISRGMFGSFNAKVEGLNASAKVKRIK